MNATDETPIFELALPFLLLLHTRALFPVPNTDPKHLATHSIINNGWW